MTKSEAEVFQSLSARLKQEGHGDVDCANTNVDAAIRLTKRLIAGELDAALDALPTPHKEDLTRRDSLPPIDAPQPASTNERSLEALRSALEHIRDAYSYECECEHDTDDCCAKLDDAEPCAFCIASVGLATGALPSPPDGWQPEKVALVNLVTKLDEILAHESYQAVWTSAFVHGVTYTGPNFKKELEAAKNVLLASLPSPPQSPRDER